jgi:arabinofuranan 3-O-arabinosyltransferase
LFRPIHPDTQGDSPVTTEPPDLFDRFRIWLGTPRVRFVLCWIVCLGVAAQRGYHARSQFDTSQLEPVERRRVDGNNGHTHIDFGGQWVFGRVAATGQFRSLYDRNLHWKIVRKAFPLESQSDAVRRHQPGAPRANGLREEDVENDANYLMTCMMGSETDLERTSAVSKPLAVAVAFGADGNPFTVAVAQMISAEHLTPELCAQFEQPHLGGPLYPPVHAFLYAPLGMFERPQDAYAVLQLASILAGFFCGWCVSRLSCGRIWWPAAVIVIFCYPGFRPGLDLGQNHVITLAIVLGGWTLAARGWPFLGGVAWGLLAFKPVWGLAFLLAPLLTRNWRFLFGLGISGLGLVLLTVPFVGIQGWKDWLTIGGQASTKYGYDPNWTNLSRDVFGLPRRILLDFSLPDAERVTPEVTFASFAVLGITLLITIGVALWRVPARRTTGLAAGFVLFGAYLACYRFMYYDAVLALAGFAALFANPAWTTLGPQAALNRSTSDRTIRLYVNCFPLTLLGLLILLDNLLIGVNPRITISPERWPIRSSEAGGWTVGSRTLTAGFDYNFPIDTLLVLAAWAWSGWRLVRDGERADEQTL